MTDEQINIAIAESCGCRYNVMNDDCVWVLNGEIEFTGPFTRDLNAMHEAEKSLTAEQEAVYVECLDRVTWDYIQADARYNAGRLTCSELQFRATARQRAEAFLRTLGKWEDDA